MTGIDIYGDHKKKKKKLFCRVIPKTGVDTYGVLLDRKLVMWSHTNVM